MAEPLGLVYSGQDGTGAAFKAPWTSYDPYKAEVGRGQQLAAIEELKAKKKEGDEKKFFDATAGSTTSYDLQNVTKHNRNNRKIKEVLAPMFAQSGGQITPEIQNYLNMAKTRSQELKATSDAQGSKRNETLKIVTSPTADKNYDIDLTKRNVGVYDNPYLAPSSEFPEVKQQLAEYEEKVRIANRNNPFMDEESIKDDAADLWRANEGNWFVSPVERLDFTDQMTKLQGAVSKMVDEGSSTYFSKDGTYTDTDFKKFTKDAARNVISNEFVSNPSWNKSMSNEWANSPDKDKYANALEYTIDKSVPYLEIDQVKSTTRKPSDGGSSYGGMSVPDGVFVTDVNTDLNYTYKPSGGVGQARILGANDRGLDIKVGTKTNRKEPEYQVSGTRYFKTSDITNPVNLTGTGDFKLIRVVKKPTLSTPISVSLEQLGKTGKKDFLGIDIESLKKDAKNGIVTIDASGIPLDKTALSTLKLLGFGSDIKDEIYQFGDIETEAPVNADVPEMGYKKQVDKGVYIRDEDQRSQLTQEVDGYDYITALNAVVPDQDYSKSTIKGTSASGNKSGAKEIKSSDISIKAKAAGYSDSEYRKLLQEKGIKIIE